jgi:hypothetical protein
LLCVAASGVVVRVSRLPLPLTQILLGAAVGVPISACTWSSSRTFPTAGRAVASHRRSDDPMRLVAWLVAIDRPDGPK